MNAPSKPVVLCLGLALASACSSNHSFAGVRRYGELPDFAQLEEALARSTPNDLGRRELGELSWIPLVTMSFDGYEQSPAGMLPGNTLSSLHAYGPLFMNGTSDEWRFDTGGSLYERKRASYAAWGLYAQEDFEVRVPTGWREQSRVSLLFGLLAWPSEGYSRGEEPPSLTAER